MGNQMLSYENEISKAFSIFRKIYLCWVILLSFYLVASRKDPQVTRSHLLCRARYSREIKAKDVKFLLTNSSQNNGE